MRQTRAMATHANFILLAFLIFGSVRQSLTMISSVDIQASCILSTSLYRNSWKEMEIVVHDPRNKTTFDDSLSANGDSLIRIQNDGGFNCNLQTITAEVPFVNGTPFADSTHSAHSRHVKYAFLGGTSAWRNGDPLPQKVWYEFPPDVDSFVVSKFGMSSRAGAGAAGIQKWPGAPAKFDLIGSFDGIKFYTVITVDVEDTTGSYFSGYDQYKEWIVPESQKRSYPFWGLRIIATTTSVIPAQPDHITNPNQAFVTNFRIWKETYRVKQRTWHLYDHEFGSRCGSQFPLEDGSPSECNPDGKYPCCSSENWCGGSNEHCTCSTCVDFRTSEHRTKGIPDGYFRLSDHFFYKFYDIPTPFADAMETCKKDNAFVAMEDDPLTAAALQSVYKKLDGEQLWLGIERDTLIPNGPDEIENFVWLNSYDHNSNNNAIVADKWAEYLLSGSGSGSGTGEDGSGSGTGEAEDCVTVGSPSFGDYAPTDCVDQFSFLCQIRDYGVRVKYYKDIDMTLEAVDKVDLKAVKIVIPDIERCASGGIDAGEESETFSFKMLVDSISAPRNRTMRVKCNYLTSFGDVDQLGEASISLDPIKEPIKIRAKSRGKLRVSTKRKTCDSDFKKCTELPTIETTPPPPPPPTPPEITETLVTVGSVYGVSIVVEDEKLSPNITVKLTECWSSAEPTGTSRSEKDFVPVLSDVDYGFDFHKPESQTLNGYNTIDFRMFQFQPNVQSYLFCNYTFCLNGIC